MASDLQLLFEKKADEVTEEDKRAIVAALREQRKNFFVAEMKKNEPKETKKTKKEKDEVAISSLELSDLLS